MDRQQHFKEEIKILAVGVDVDINDPPWTWMKKEEEEEERREEEEKKEGYQVLSIKLCLCEKFLHCLI